MDNTHNYPRDSHSDGYDTLHAISSTQVDKHDMIPPLYNIYGMHLL